MDLLLYSWISYPLQLLESRKVFNYAGIDRGIGTVDAGIIATVVDCKIYSDIDRWWNPNADSLLGNSSPLHYNFKAQHYPCPHPSPSSPPPCPPPPSSSPFYIYLPRPFFTPFLSPSPPLLPVTDNFLSFLSSMISDLFLFFTPFPFYIYYLCSLICPSPPPPPPIPGTNNNPPLPTLLGNLTNDFAQYDDIFEHFPLLD